MDNSFTHYLSYSDISVDDADLFEDAFFCTIDHEFIRGLLRELRLEPSTGVIERILAQV